jgi:hypothetical protein
MLRQERQQAQQAIEQLLKTLPLIIAQERRSQLISAKEFGEHGPEHASASLFIFYNVLLRVRPLLVSDKRAGWHNIAYELFAYYRKVVDPDCGHSADGPAVRFIKSALDELGIPTWSNKAIEKAVERYWRRPRHRKSDECSGTRSAAVS